MRVVATSGRPDLAVAYIGDFGGGRRVEFVEAVAPPRPRGEKWVVIVSTLYGCPVRCAMCDAGGDYRGKLSRAEIFAQLDFLVRTRFGDGAVPSRQFKVQFARVGEPAFNCAVLDVLDELPRRYDAPGLMPAISTIAPAGTDAFFAGLLAVKRRHYRGGDFQLQFSVHTTDDALRARLIPAETWPLGRIAAYGECFFAAGDRKVTLNFALAAAWPLDARVLADVFDPAKFVVKITPLNPTYRARANGLESYIVPSRRDEDYAVVRELRRAGYDVIVSVGEPEENLIGSNCGQYLREHLAAAAGLEGGYSYDVRELSA